MKILFLIFLFENVIAFSPETWVGDGPENLYNGQSFYSNWPIQKQLRKYFSTEDYLNFNKIIPNGLGSEIKKIDGHLIFRLCEAHACNAHSYQFFYNLKTKILSVCRFNLIDTKSKDGKWFGPIPNIGKIKTNDKTAEDYCALGF